VRTQIGPFAAPDVVHWAPALPKTRSGKIMRRILRKVAAGDVEHLGDTSTLSDASVVASLMQMRPQPLDARAGGNNSNNISRDAPRTRSRI
jgi:acetyl-CoA synthetase